MVSLRRLGEAQNWRCAYCGVSFKIEDGHASAPTRDHVLPRCAGGMDEWMNIVAACWACNAAKGDIVDATGFAKWRERYALSGRWLPGTPPRDEDLQSLLRRIREDEYDTLLDDWRQRRGLTRPNASERQQMLEEGGRRGLIYDH